MSRRADRLFQIVQLIGGRRLTTAAQLAERLEVSERTIYRDIRDLSLSGVPIDGEAGSGYRLLPGYHLPPLMFTSDEVEVMFAALEMVKRSTGENFAQRAQAISEKLLAILPTEKRRVVENSRIVSPSYPLPDETQTRFDRLHTAMAKRQVITLHYQNQKGERSVRDVYPLGLSFQQGEWLVIAWCEMREDYRCFLLKCCHQILITCRHFTERDDRSLSQFIQRQRQAARD